MIHYQKIGLVLIASLLVFLGGCGGSDSHAPPRPQVAFPSVELDQSEESQESAEENSPNQEVRLPVRKTQERVLARPKARQRKNPFDRGQRRARPSRPSAPSKPPSKPKKSSPPKTPPPPRVKKVEKKLSLGGPLDYPTFKVERIPPPAGTAGAGPEIALQKIDEEAAVPTHHPPITILGLTDYRWIDCCFEVREDGSFEVYLLTQINDPIHEAIAMRTLNKWRWKPKTIKGSPVASQEFLRLRSRVTRR